MPRFMNMKTALQCTLLAMLLSSVSAVAATIVPDDDVPARRVNFADLNLTRSEGAAVLYARINAAAREYHRGSRSRSVFLQIERYT